MKIENETEKKINQESVAITSQVCGWRLLRICTFPVCVCKTENLMVKLIIYVFFTYIQGTCHSKYLLIQII